MQINESPEFRQCLYCRKEIPSDKQSNTCFCNGEHRAGFARGMSTEAYREAVDRMLLVPIRNKLPPKLKRRKHNLDNKLRKRCKLPSCPNWFTTTRLKKDFCTEECQISFNSIKAQERRVAKRNDN